MKKKLFAAISLGILSTFVSGALTASAAELIVNGGPNNMTAEQKAEWVGEIQGGYGIAHDISMNNNRLELNGGDYSKYQIKGGYAAEGDANNNIVDISGEVENTSNIIYGGYTENGEANGNKVSFDGVKFTADRYEIRGGYSKLGDVSGNTIEIDNSNRAYDKDNEMMWIAGGETKDGNAENNSIIITDSSLYGGGYTTTQNALMGGYSHKGDALSNSIEVSGSNLNGYLEGGRAFAGNALDNHVVVEGGSLDDAYVYGAAVDTGDGNIEYNSVSIKNTYVDASEIIGGYGNIGGDNQEVHVGELSKNAVEIVNSSFNGMVCGAMDKGYSELVGNKVMIKESDNISKENGKDYNANVDIYGGRSLSDALVQGNTVKIINSSLLLEKRVADSENRIFGGRGKGVIKENNVTVYNSTFEGQLIGGHCEVNEFASVVGNIVGIKDSTVVGDVIAAQNKAGMAVDNRILLTGGKTDVSQANLIGATNAEKGKGNTLSLMDWSGKALSVAGFDAYEFIYNKIKDITKPMLSVGSVNDIDNGTEFSMYFDESVKLTNGQKLTLIASDTAIGTVINESQTADIGFALEADGALMSDGNNINFEISAIRANHQTDIVGTANAAAASFVADGAQLAVDGMEQLNRDEYGFNTFASAYGSNGDYDNGVDMKGWNTMVGVGHNSETESGAFAWGVFYETGSGEMKAENSYRKAAFGVDGKAVYNGYGAAARLSKDNGVYYEAGLRAGKLKNNLNNALMNAALATEGYKTESDYLGYHVGVGKAVALDNGDQLDVYARYYHTQVDGDSFVASGGERYYLDKVYSDRIRVGGRYSDELNEAVKVYYGAAYEYEFSGEAEGSVKGYALNKSDLGGSSFVGELGLLMNNPGSAWTVDMSLQTYAGQYEGIGGKVQATYHF